MNDLRNGLFAVKLATAPRWPYGRRTNRLGIVAEFARRTGRGLGALLLTAAVATSGIPAVAKDTSPAPTDGALTIVIVMDNYVVDPRLISLWGFSAAVISPTDSILFDTGSQGKALLANMKKLGLEPRQFSKIVVSHTDADHIGGLNDFLQANASVEVFLPGPAAAESHMVQAAGAKYRSVIQPTEIAAGIRTTGRMGMQVDEQALILDTEDGLVVITGCAHPGIVSMVAKVLSLNPGKRLALVMGGFHLVEASSERIDAIVQSFRRMKVERVAPSHCSGELARQRFKESYGPDYVESGVGLRLRFAPPR